MRPQTRSSEHSEPNPAQSLVPSPFDPGITPLTLPKRRGVAREHGDAMGDSELTSAKEGTGVDARAPVQMRTRPPSEAPITKSGWDRWPPSMLPPTRAQDQDPDLSSPQETDASPLSAGHMNSEDNQRTMHSPVTSMTPDTMTTPLRPVYTPGSATVVAAAPSSPPVLAPRIVVTPEFLTADDGGAAASVWAAMQASAQYGFLYDVLVEIVLVEIASAAESTVLEILDDRACATVLYPDSRLLFVAYIHLEPSTSNRPGNDHVRQASDVVIEDPERAPGVLTEYVEVRVRYCHSTFPPRWVRDADSRYYARDDGAWFTGRNGAVAGWRYPHPPALPWTPPRPSPLFEIVAAHWGVENAHAVMRRVIRSRSGVVAAVVQSSSFKPPSAALQTNPLCEEKGEWGGRYP
ncbi:hypothetical protein VTJ49DRAFT_3897 [Mycothermus thermophilus]|uniref:Uncharacterized protein n=1 Tax=Humicola insolens TaxID=85995 RepID=A0ABR3VLV8_HUMIN